MNKLAILTNFIAKKKDGLKSILEIESKLAFIPSRASQHSEYKRLGASAGGVYSACGFSAMNKIFHTPMGKLSILEENLIAASGFALVEPEYLNTYIGKHLASLIVLKGRDNGAFMSEIYWTNSASNRAFTVKISINLNDPNNSAQKKDLIGFLTKSYGD